MFKSIAVLSLAVSSVYGHAFITSVQGANGLSSAGFAVDTTGKISRTGTGEQPFQIDTPVLKNLKDDPCGATLLAGSINIATELATAEKAGLATVPANGSLTLGLHQVNADGGGPFTAEINTDGTGAKWTATTVSSQPPGVNGLLHNGPADSFITVDMPASTKCTGGAGKNACLIRLSNGGAGSGSIANGAGPFGGCVAVAQGTGNAAGNAGGNAAAGASASGIASATGTAVVSSPPAAVTTKAANGKGAANNAPAKAAGNNKNAKNARMVSRAFYKTMAERRAVVSEETFLKNRALLSAQLIDEIKTATGTAIDIPIDALANQLDDAALGGNSTAAGGILTAQQAVDLRKAVQVAIANALNVLNLDVDAGKFGSDEATTDAANAEALAQLESGEIKSFNAGNAGVGEPNTAVVNSLLGGIAGVGEATAAAGKGATATATNVAPTATTAAANGTGRGNAGGKNGAGAANAGASKASANGAAKGANRNNRRTSRFFRNRM